MFGLIQLLYFLNQYQKISNDIFTLSRDSYQVRYRLSPLLILSPPQSFPFSVVSLNITKIGLECVREGKLNKMANKLGSVLDAMNELYVGGFYQMYMQW
jgi:hypothetical protein